MDSRLMDFTRLRVRSVTSLIILCVAFLQIMTQVRKKNVTLYNMTSQKLCNILMLLKCPITLKVVIPAGKERIYRCDYNYIIMMSL